MKKKNEKRSKTTKSKNAGSKRKTTVKNRRSTPRTKGNKTKLTSSERENLRLLKQFAGEKTTNIFKKKGKRSRDKKQKTKGTDTALSGITKRIKPLEIKKIRGENSFLIKLNYNGFQNKVIAINESDFSAIRKFLDKRNPPKNAIAIFKIKKPGETGYFYVAKVSPPELHIDADNVKQWLAELLADYNNNTLDIIAEYDEPTKQYNIISVTIRFNF